ncbi:sce7726 family protein [Cohnella kolymensis]|uniref:sce7726 family protein n=1 Tax=Cohnella kolymensis TaxID=1590652 RepID=UPI001F171B9A|nr:sce7726 family protein [Cohnella kolymensis]
MSANNNLLLNRIFTKSTFTDWIKNHKDSDLNESIRKYLSNSPILNKDVISQIYKTMLKSHRNEYIYKNTLLNKLLLGRHSIKSTIALTEIPIEKSKADFILINGKAVVYEIKTELDNFDRLIGQLKDYYKAFDYVCVITSESNYKNVLTLLQNTDVGLCTLTRRNTISTKKRTDF